MDSAKHGTSSSSRKCICLSVTAVVLGLGLLFLILGLTVFKAKHPVITVNSISLDDLSFSFDLTKLRLLFNVTLDVNVSVKNPNRVGFKYHNSTAFLRHRGNEVGEVPFPAGRIGARGVGGTSFRLRSPSLNSVRLRRIFDIFDTNDDSIITVEELSQALALLGLQAEFAQLESMVKSYIQPGNEGLRYDDFEALHRSLGDEFFGFSNEPVEIDEKQEESDLSEAFKVFDEDGDGYISARELQEVLGKLGLQEGREMERVEMMISSVDQNRDGRVDFFEFKDMMRSVVVPSS